jgi:hypothetical protein
MAVPLPVVRYMIPCEDVIVDAENSHRVSVVNLVTLVRPGADTAYPLLMRQLCVYAQLAEIRVAHKYRVVISRVGGLDVIRTQERLLPAGPNPLTAHTFVFRMTGLVWPEPGLYEVDLLCDDQAIAQQAIRAI